MRAGSTENEPNYIFILSGKRISGIIDFSKSTRNVGILKVHHKDRNRKNSLPDNLEILCPNCHDLEHFLQKDGVYSGGKRGRSVSVNTSGLQPEIGS